MKGGVNAVWATDKLDEFISRVDHHVTKSGSDSSKLPVLDMEYVVTRILRAADQQLTNCPWDNRDYFRTALDNAARAKGILRDRQEADENLGPLGPTLYISSMHHVMWDAAAQLWKDGHHTQAVQRAAIFLNAHVQARVSRTDVSDADLMNQVFSKDPAKKGRPRLRWPGPADDRTVISMNEGLRRLAPGVFMTVRNSATHGTDELTQQEAGEQLAVLSMLAGWIDACEVDSANEADLVST